MLSFWLLFICSKNLTIPSEEKKHQNLKFKLTAIQNILDFHLLVIVLVVLQKCFLVSFSRNKITKTNVLMCMPLSTVKTLWTGLPPLSI